MTVQNLLDILNQLPSDLEIVVDSGTNLGETTGVKCEVGRFMPHEAGIDEYGDFFPDGAVELKPGDPPTRRAVRIEPEKVR